MSGVLWFLFWQVCGCTVIGVFFREKRLAVRLWLGSVLGTLLSMWMPVPFAFFAGFTVRAHVYALLLGAALLCATLLCRRRLAPAAPAAERDSRGDRALLFLLPPLFAVCMILLSGHTLREIDGALYTGQCTYGDMAMHLGIITSIAEQGVFPPFYSILPTAQLCYPFLCDTVSASLYVLGSSLRLAYMLPMAFAFLQVFCGFWFLAREVLERAGTAALAFVLFFLNGGLGIIYFFRDYSFGDMMTGFYETPTNLTEKGIRWVNVLVDMLLPQRATLFGWAALLGVLYLLFRAVFRDDRRCFLPAGLMGGLLPMVHTHSFFSLGLCAACWLLVDLRRQGLNRQFFRDWLLFGGAALLLAVPQLLEWTLRSVGGNSSFLRLGFDWVNAGQENWLWFWVKNVGPVFLIAPLAYLFGSREDREVFSGAILIFVISELILFQPNPYDNNKLLYIWYLFCCLLSAKAVTGLLERVRSPAARRAALAVLLLVCTNAALLSTARELISATPEHAYELFSADELAAAEYIGSSTEPNALFLTRDNHDNAVAALTGRNILCGSSSYLYFHGLDYSGMQQTARRMLTDAAVFAQCRETLGVDYVWISQHESALPGCISAYFRENYSEVFSSATVRIYDVRAAAD